jgi:hypothetical protein
VTSPFALPSGRCTGKLPARDSGLPEFKSYLSAAPPSPPSQAHYGGRVKVPWGMDGNGPDPSVTILGPNFEGVGDCVPTACAHFDLMSNYDEANQEPVEYGNAVVSTYCQLLDITPAELEANPALDTGCDIATVLQTWATTGLYGTKIAGYAPVDLTSLTDLQQGLAFAGGLVIGVNLPVSAESQFPGEWTYEAGSPILGGHCVLLTGYDGENFSGCTWGQLIEIEWEFLANYLDEAYAVVSPQAATSGQGPDPYYGAANLDLAQLQADIASLD